jgi:N-acetylglucosamine repressor
MSTSSGHSAMKLSHQLAILRLIREEGPLTRVRVQRDTGLSWGTVTTLVRELVQRRLVVETGPVRTRAGRRPVELEINGARNLAAGLRLGGANVRAVLLDLTGRVVASARLEAGARGARRSILDRMFKCLETVLAKAGVSTGALAGIGIALPGAVDARTGTGLYSPHHPHWKDVPVRDLFQRRYSAPCFIDHDNNCCAMGESWFGQARGVDDFLCVILGTGISVGIVIGGNVYRGADSMAGELGHVVMDPSGPVCACGRRGCLEAFASGSALARVGQALARENRVTRALALAGGDPLKVTARHLEEAAAAGDADARRAYEDMGRVLGRGIAMLINLFNPSRVILCGQVSRAQEFFLPAALQSIQEVAWDYSRKIILVSSVEDPATLGAAGIVLDQAFTTGLLIHAKRR